MKLSSALVPLALATAVSAILPQKSFMVSWDKPDVPDDVYNKAKDSITNAVSNRSPPGAMTVTDS